MLDFAPAIIAREILLRKNIVFDKTWTNVVVVSVCLVYGAFYELIEWAVATISSESADAFLGSRGDICDIQAEMSFAPSTTQD